MAFFAILIMLLSAIAIIYFISKSSEKVIVLPLGVFEIVIFTLWSSFYQISAGYIGIVYQFSDIIGQRDSGLQWVAPWQSVKSASIKIQSITYTGKKQLTSFSKQTQDVFVDVIVNYYVDKKDIQNLYRTVGPDYKEILINPRVEQIFKDETVKYDTTDIAPHREQIRKVATERLKKELQKDSIVVTDVLLKNISFNTNFQSSIERAQIAKQDAIKEQENIKAAEYKAEQAVKQANGEAQAIWVLALKQAEANKKLSESITSQLIQYEAIKKLSPNVSVMMLPVNSNMIMPSELLKSVTTTKGRN